MTLTKTQISYLNEKLEREVRTRVGKFREKLGIDKCTDKVIAEKINKGKLKLLSTKEIISLINRLVDRNGYFIRLSVEDLVNQEQLKELRTELANKQDKVADYERKLITAKQNAMDMYVLGGVDIQTALKEFDKIDKEIDKE